VAAVRSKYLSPFPPSHSKLIAGGEVGVGYYSISPLRSYQSNAGENRDFFIEYFNLNTVVSKGNVVNISFFQIKEIFVKNSLVFQDLDFVRK
jgi:hypothetical protein